MRVLSLGGGSVVYARHRCEDRVLTPVHLRAPGDILLLPIHFQVSTKGAGEGPLSVSIQGPHRGAVVKVSVTYTGLDNYTVMYKVIEPGYYIVAIRWANWPIPDSPIMCKVTP